MEARGGVALADKEQEILRIADGGQRCTWSMPARDWQQFEVPSSRRCEEEAVGSRS